MNPIENTSLPTVRVAQCRPDLAGLVSSTLAGALAALQRESHATPDSTLWWQCLGAVEQLWQRRDAVARALALQQGQWPPTPNACDAGLRWVVERASDDPAVRFELMELGTQLLMPRLAELRRRLPAGVLSQEPAHPADATPGITVPAPLDPHAAALIESVQAGGWFRIYLHDQWAAAQLTWRSDNGRYFMFSSRLAGRSHALSRSALERMIARGQFENLVRLPASTRSAASAVSVVPT